MVRHELVEDDGRTTVRLHGELDWGGRLKLEPVLERSLATAREGAMSIDLRAVSFIDSSGVSLLIEMADQARRNGTSLNIVPPAPPVFRVFEVLGLVDVLPFGERIGA